MLRKPTANHDIKHERAVRQHGPQNHGPGAVAPAPPDSPQAASEKDESKGLEKLLRKCFDEQTARLKPLLAEAGKRGQENDSHLQIVAECQKQTAALANGLLERQALQPAVETVHELAVVLEELSKQAAALTGSHTQCPVFEPLIEAIDQAAKMAAVKRQYLGAEAIEPSPGEAFDSRRHEIQRAVPTDDPSRQRTIEGTMVVGLAYRDKVLRPAKVSVYRFTDQSSNHAKGERHDDD